MGLSFLAAMLMMNDPSPVASSAPIGIGGLHAMAVIGFWLNRQNISFRFAWRVTMGISVICTDLLASVFGDTIKPAESSSLVSLAAMQAIFAVTLPLHYQPVKRTMSASSIRIL